MLRDEQPKEKTVGKLVTGFVLGFLACVWTYGLNPTEAVFGFSHKISAAHDRLQEEYRVDPKLGHKGQYSNFNRKNGRTVSGADAESIDALAQRAGNWLSQAGGPPAM